MAETVFDQKKLTPMMEQVRSIRKTLPSDTILFFRLGDFYEMFFEDAVRASEILNITLTGRAGGGGRVPMCGVPYHAFQSHVRTLLNRNLKVAICEQIGDPKASKGLVERKVTRIITPATFLDEEAAAPRPERIAAVGVNGKQAAVAALDAATGEFFVRETAPARLLETLSALRPREVVLPEGLAREESFLKGVRDLLGAVVTRYEGWVFDPAEGGRLLREGLGLASDRAIAFHDRPAALSAAGAVIYYLRDHGHAALAHLQIPLLQESNDFMTLDRPTLRNLELVESASGLREGGTLFSVLDRTTTPMGRRTLFDWVIHPLTLLAAVRLRQAGTAELAENRDRLAQVRGALKGIRDVERVLSRLNFGVANGRDLLALKEFLERVPLLRMALKGARAAVLTEIREALDPLKSLQELIARAVVESPPMTIREGGLIRDGFCAELDDLRRASSEGKGWLMAFQQRESQRTGIRNLKIRYSQVFGYAIEISKSNLKLAPADYIRRQTLANAERFVTPELKAWDEKISRAEERIKGLEAELFEQLRQAALAEVGALQKTARAVGRLDGLGSLAAVAAENGWVRPELGDSRRLEVAGGRHPVVEQSLPPGQFVENDLTLDGEKRQLIVLTGPNMAGKSTTIRQAALITLLAQIGAFVPARSARVGLVDRIFTRIGASDDLARGESTFMVEMVEMAHILQQATDRSLLILDEVGRGTSTFDGVSLAWAICEHLIRGAVRPRTLFATHYHELAQLEGELPGVVNETMTVREGPEGIVFLRKVRPGASDRSYGIHVAMLAGIPKPVTRRAAEILKILESENSAAAVQIGVPKRSGAAPTDLFSPPADHPLLEELKGLSLETLTPLEALNRIAAWKQRLEQEDSA